MTRDELCRRYRTGERLDDLAEAAGVSRQTLYKRLHRAGEPLRGRPRKPFAAYVVHAAAGEPIHRIARGEGVAYMAPYQRFVRSGTLRGLADVVGLTPIQLAHYRAAVDELGLRHDDAMEIAREYDFLGTRSTRPLPER